MKEFELLRAMREKVDGIHQIRARLEELDIKFAEQVGRLDQVQSKVELSVSTPGALHQDNVQVARVLKETTNCREAGVARMAAEGCLAASLMLA